LSQIHVNRIKTALEKTYSGIIDLSDIQNRPKEELEKHFLTRSQAALALGHAADIDTKTASASIVDGFGDNGIDALYFDIETDIVYIVQSKWISSGNGTPNVGEVQKYIQGIRDLLTEKFDRFSNTKVIAKKDEITKALENTDVTFQLVLAYTGTQDLSQPVKQPLDDYLAEMNVPTTVLSLKLYSQKQLLDVITGCLQGNTIDIDVTLYHWGIIKEPYTAYYGQVPAVEIAQWYEANNNRLLARNLRKFKGDTEVNLSIKNTLENSPAEFWYFNNGITILCKKIGKKPRGGSDKSVGLFVCEGVSIVNGAQTVGCIASMAKYYPEKLNEASVLVRFISLEECPPDFSIEVTTATNTQNKIERRDFASLDPLQERLRQDLLLDENKIYAYKGGDLTPPHEGCAFEEAAIALACANGDLQLAVDAKQKISTLWSDIKRPPYTTLFNDKLSARYMWRCVETLRSVDNALAREKERRTQTARLVAVHGNRFILHEVFKLLPTDSFDNPQINFEEVREQTISLTIKMLESAATVINHDFPYHYLNTFFKNYQKCLQLSALINGSLTGKLPIDESVLPSQYDMFDSIDTK